MYETIKNLQTIVVGMSKEKLFDLCQSKKF